jgi:hypothetical protein
MLCNFFPITSSNSINNGTISNLSNQTTNNGLPISIEEIIIIVWVTLFLVDEIREVNYLK